MFLYSRLLGESSEKDTIVLNKIWSKGHFGYYIYWHPI